RKFEYKIQKKAYKKSIAAKPIFFNNNFMIYEYEKGIHKIVLSNKEIKNLVSKVKIFHKFKIKEKPYDLKNDFLNYSKILKDEKNTLRIKESLKILKRIKISKKDLVLCHHDLNPKNIIFKKSHIKIIDWEYAGINNRFFDLAALCVEFNLNKKKQQVLLNTYFDKHQKNHIRKLNQFKIIYSNLCHLWFDKLKTLK
ncbi:MAG: phosphotransferase, partial [Aliarcobacter sp.]|nr:phosphotransferase [Aliarcobacter sp.]